MKRALFFLLLLTSFGITNAQVTQSIELSGTWKVTWNEGGHGPQSLVSYLQSDPSKDPARFLDVPVPMELHLALQKAGLVEDINYGMNTLKARWVAEKYWFYVRTFTVPDEALKQKASLVFDQLNLNAIILLNGEQVGTHNSAFVPCRMFSTSSAVFWMYNDSWPATHGWTIVDYYLRKKLAYHPVRRAYQPVTTVVAMENDSVKVFGVNDGPDEWQGTVRYGICLLAGGLPVNERHSVTVPANTSVLLAAFPAEKWKAVDRKVSGAGKRTG